MLQKGDRGVKAEESKYAAQAVLNFHGALPAAIGVMLDDVRSDESSRRAISDGRACVVPVQVRIFLRIPLVVRVYQTSLVLNACNDGEVGAGCDNRSWSGHVLVFVE